MLDVSVLPMFLGACLLLAVSPGPDLLLLMSYSSIKGFKAGTAIAGGIFFSRVAAKCFSCGRVS